MLAAGAPAASAWDPQTELQNFQKVNERQAVYNAPEFRAQLVQRQTQEGLDALAITAADPERQFLTDLCWSHWDGCAGDVRLYDWQANGHGVVQPVLFTARNGATLSGHVWATKAGPAKRPGIVITNGSVQATEELYWYEAQVLAKAGYVVLTWDPQGQGRSDTQGAAPDEQEGTPSQSDGRPFFDGTVDALNFFFSAAASPYAPIKSCESGTSHAPKQERRVKAGLNAGFNPFWGLLDTSRVGVAGHSYGASGVSYVGQADPRVKAIVGWDNLRTPSTDQEQPCPADPTQRAAAAITKPALGISNDYGITPQPFTEDPDPLGKAGASREYSKAGVDSGEIVIRGGTHLESSFIPNPAFGATLRGADLIAWYTTAWFDKYVKGDPTADARVLTARWRNDADEAAVDPVGDGNMFSFYFRSRLDVGLTGGGRFTCENLRDECELRSDDGFAGRYSYLDIATSPDAPGAAALPATAGLAPQACASRRRIAVRVARRAGVRVLRVNAYAGKRRVASSKSRVVRVALRGLPRGKAKLRLRVTARRAGRRVAYTVSRVVRTC